MKSWISKNLYEKKKASRGLFDYILSILKTHLLNRFNFTKEKNY